MVRLNVIYNNQWNQLGDSNNESDYYKHLIDFKLMLGDNKST